MAGVTGAATSLVYLGTGIGWVSVALLLSEARFNDHFEDLYLTIPQSFGSISILLGPIYLAPEIGFYFVAVIFVVLGFGALRMSARQTGLVWTYATLGLTYLFAVSGKPIAIPMETAIERDLALLCFVTALGRCASTGLYGSSLREMLYKRGNELREAHARIEELAQIDDLTGALNRRFIMKALNEEMSRAQRSGTSFKRINDRYGHPVGDEVLKTFAIAVEANVRAVDKLGRYGGEEFLLVLPGRAEDQALIAIDGKSLPI